MCGIAGVVLPRGADGAGEDTVRGMLARTKHRGPDHTGVQRLSERVVIGHNRLAIVDLEPRANQPMIDNELAVVFNGELYNFRELRRQLEQSGAVFRTQCDTEVLLHGFRAWGPELPKHLDGMFAYALYDGSQDRLTFASDRLGKKPLYYLQIGSALYFASEAKAFFSVDEWDTREIDLSVAAQVLEYPFATSLSLWSAVAELLPGHTLTLDINSGHLTVKPYFTPTDLVDPATWERFESSSEGELADELDHLLLRAVEKRLMGDVPVSTINSGGLDSSLISALASRFTPVEMFHIDVIGDSELPYAQQVADRLKLPLRHEPFDAEDFDRDFAPTVCSLEFPLIHPNNVAVYSLARLIGQSGFKVVLGGEVADEAFGGYPHQARLLALRNKPILAHAVRALHRVSDASCLQTVKKVDVKSRHPVLSEKTVGVCSALDYLLLDDYRECQQAYGFVKDPFERSYAALLAFDVAHYLRPLLMRGDKLFMAHGVEQRLPFADTDLLAFALNLPSRFRNQKSLLKTVAERYLPKTIVHRAKNGFRVAGPRVRRPGSAGRPEAAMMLLDQSLRVIRESYES
jgi:asparagine synthase (glutamine-hydrolysing)